MRIKSFYNAVFGIATEVLYALTIILVAFLICITAYLLNYDS